jgi:hypothetical protein
LIVEIFTEINANFFAENLQTLQKFVIVTSTTETSDQNGCAFPQIFICKWTKICRAENFNNPFNAYFGNPACLELRRRAATPHGEPEKERERETEGAYAYMTIRF